MCKTQICSLFLHSYPDKLPICRGLTIEISREKSKFQLIGSDIMMSLEFPSICRRMLTDRWKPRNSNGGIIGPARRFRTNTWPVNSSQNSRHQKMNMTWISYLPCTGLEILLQDIIRNWLVLPYSYILYHTPNEKTRVIFHRQICTA